MRLFTLVLFSLQCSVGFAAPAEQSLSRDVKFRDRTLRQFEAHLERALSSEASASELRARVMRWMTERADQIAQDPITTYQSWVPWAAEAERAYATALEERARAVVAALVKFHLGQGDAESRSPLMPVAEAYAILATYRGNLSAQLVTGTAQALVPLAIVYEASPYVALLIGEVVGGTNKLWEFLAFLNDFRNWSVISYGSAVVGASLNPRVRHFYRGLGYPGERSAGADRLERGFWNKVREGIGRHRDLQGYLPETPDANFPIFFFTRLGLTGQVPGQCEALLAT